MKVVEILQINRISLEMLQKACIKLSDLQYLKLYEEYVSMVSSGEKKSYVIAVLMDKYNVSERQVYYIVKRFESECTMHAD